MASNPQMGMDLKPTQQAVAALIFTSIFCTIATSSVVLRYHTRKITSSLLAVDIWILVALIFLYGIVITIFISIFCDGLGHHYEDVPFTGLTGSEGLLDPGETPDLRGSHIKRLALPKALAWTWSTTSAKISIILLYLKTSTSTPRHFRQVAWLTLTAAVFYACGNTIFLLTKCQPLAASWDASYGANACSAPRPGRIATNVSNLAIDTIVLALPVLVVRFPRRQLPLLIRAIWVLGLTAVMTAAAQVATAELVDSLNFPTTDIPSAILAALEATLAIVCAAALVCRTPGDRCHPMSAHLQSPEQELSAGISPDRRAPNRRTSTAPFDKPSPYEFTARVNAKETGESHTTSTADLRRSDVVAHNAARLAELERAAGKPPSVAPSALSASASAQSRRTSHERTEPPIDGQWELDTQAESDTPRQPSEGTITVTREWYVDQMKRAESAASSTRRERFERRDPRGKRGTSEGPRRSGSSRGRRPASKGRKSADGGERGDWEWFPDTWAGESHAFAERASRS